jgi:phosphatidylglycerol:prolipoprotein diacylglycerol transferase
MTWLLDRLAIVVPLSGMCIRLGNLMNSEIIGRPTDVPWGFWFVRVDAIPVARHPTQIYEALICLVLFVLMAWLYRRGLASSRPGFMIGLLMVLLFTSRFFVEYLKELQEAFEASLPIDMGQILSLPFIVAGLIFLARSRRFGHAG